MEKAWKRSWSKALNIICETWWSRVMAWACMVSSDDETEDRSSRKNSEVYIDILSAQVQSNGAKLIRRRFIVQMDNDPKHTEKSNQGVLKVKKLNILQWPSQSPDFNPIEHAFNLLNDKTKGRKTHKQGTTEVSCSKGLAEHPEGGNPWVPDLRQALPAKDSQQNIKNENVI